MTEWPPFSSDLFLNALADWYYPGAKPAIVECEGKRYRTLVRGRRKKPVSGVYAFPFYLEPLDPALAAGRAIRVPHLSQVQVAITRPDEPGPQGAQPSPFVRLTDFQSWDEMLKAAAPRPGINSPTRIRQKMNRVRRELGDIELRTNDTDAEAFEQVLQWKIAHYSRSWASHRLAITRNQEFYRELWRRGFYTFTSLRFGGRLAAGKIGCQGSGRLLWRVTTYDPELGFHSPGSILEMLSLKAEWEAGSLEYDYLMGDEQYKFTFATHVRWIADVGREPRVDRWLRRGRMHLARRVTRAPGLYKLAKRGEAALIGLRKRLTPP